MNKLKSILQISLLSVLLVGCAPLLPSTKHDAAATKSADNIASQQSISLEKMVELVPPGLAVPPQDEVTSSPITQPSSIQPVQPPAAYRAIVRVQASSGQQAGSTTAASAKDSVTLPMGVKLILAGIGIILVVVGLRFAWSSAKKTSFGAAIGVADGLLADRIRAIRTQSVLSTDHKDIAASQVQIADLEAQRGKLAKSLTSV